MSVKLTIEQIKVKWMLAFLQLYTEAHKGTHIHPHTHTHLLLQPLIEGSGKTVNKMMTAGD